MKKIAIVLVCIIGTALAGMTIYLIVEDQNAKRAAAERQAAEAARAADAEERALQEARDAREAEELEREFDEIERERRQRVVRRARKEIEASIRGEYTDLNVTDVGCTLTAKRTYRCIVEYYDDFWEEEASDLIEAQVANDGGWVWSEIDP